MNQSDKPEWASKYCELGFSENWAQKVLEKYPDKLIEALSNDLSPINYITIDFADLSDEPLSKFPDPPDGHTFTEVVLAVFDIIQSFSENVPKKDKEIYSMYEEMKDDNRFDTPEEFPEFYRFCRQVQYNDLTKLSQYKKLNETYSHYINTDKPDIGSNWLITYNEEEYEVTVQGENPVVSGEVADPEFYCQVTKVVTDKAEEFEIGDFVDLPPSCFDKKLD